MPKVQGGWEQVAWDMWAPPGYELRESFPNNHSYNPLVYVKVCPPSFEEGVI